MEDTLASLVVGTIASITVPGNSIVSGVSGLVLVVDKGHVEDAGKVVGALEPLDTPVIGSVGEEGLLKR